MTDTDDDVIRNALRTELWHAEEVLWGAMDAVGNMARTTTNPDHHGPGWMVARPEAGPVKCAEHGLALINKALDRWRQASRLYAAAGGK